jgi:hypothetical protein
MAAIQLHLAFLAAFDEHDARDYAVELHGFLGRERARWLALELLAATGETVVDTVIAEWLADGSRIANHPAAKVQVAIKAECRVRTGTEPTMVAVRAALKAAGCLAPRTKHGSFYSIALPTRPRVVERYVAGDV